MRGCSLDHARGGSLDYARGCSLDHARGCSLVDSNLAAVTVDYFVLDDSEVSSDEQWLREGRVEPMDVPSTGQGKATLSLHWSPQQGRGRPH